MKTTSSDNITSIYHHPALEVQAEAICTASTRANEWNSIVSDVKHINETIAIQNI
jgi:hypothetical protein